MKNKLITCIAAVTTVLTVQSHAALLVTGQTQTIVYTVDNGDLLQTNLASTVTVGTATNGDGGGDNGAGWTVLYDGAFGDPGSGPTFRASPSATDSITFNLDLTTNTAGYNITDVNTFNAWGDPGRDRQNYTLSYSTVSAPLTFINLTTVAYPTFDPASNPINNFVSITDDSFGFVMQNVASIRFTFDAQENGWVGYREFDVIGTAAAIPEPSTVLTVLAGSLGLVCWMRRRNVA